MSDYINYYSCGLVCAAIQAFHIVRKYFSENPIGKRKRHARRRVYFKNDSESSEDSDSENTNEDISTEKYEGKTLVTYTARTKS